MQSMIPVTVKGHCKIVDDLGNVLLDKDNAIHPQNMARVIARALANEHNFFVNRLAFGNGGTTVDAAFTVTYNTPNDGQAPDTATWDSRIYNETYSEIVDDSNTALLGTDPGSADLYTGVRTGGGAVPSSDPASVEHVSGPGVRSSELGLTSQVVVECVLNGDEPLGQYVTDSLAPTSSTESSFVFDEIGLYTSGAAAIATSGYQYVNVGNRIATDDTGLLPSTSYSFDISVNGSASVPVSFTTPASGSGVSGQILYGDLCDLISSSPSFPTNASVSITDPTNTFPTVIPAGTQTYGYLKFESTTSGVGSSIDLTGANSTQLFESTSGLNPPAGGTIETAVAGTDAGFQNAPTSYTTERERLLAHLIFSPVLKSANRTLTITYTLTVTVARTPA